MLQKHILFATDFTDADSDAFRQSCVFARAWKAKLLITHVNREPGRGPAEKPASTTVQHPKQKDVFGIEPDIDYQHVTRAGDTVDVILEIEKEHDADLIVLGTHGRKGIKRMFQGSVAESIIRSAHCPVLTLRKTDSWKPVRKDHEKKILVPIDFSVYSVAALDFASSVAQAIDAVVTILHIDDSDEAPMKESADGTLQLSEDRKKLWAQLKKFEPRDKGIRFGHKILAGPAKSQIAQYADEENYEYIVLGTHGRSGIGRALMGSVTEQVVRTATCPVVTVKPSNKRNPVFHY